ncbi:MAG: DUF6625 family protein [Acetobacteraceae bacterium]
MAARMASVADRESLLAVEPAVAGPAPHPEPDVATSSAPRIKMIILWFGPWPPWMRLFLESCRWNPTVDWLLVGDSPPPADVPPNVRIVTMTFAAYRALAAERLGITPEWTDVYKLCDLKPTLGEVHRDEVAGYDYWGFGDLDVIYGDIRRFYTPELLVHDVISPHDHIVAGHFSLLRTSEAMLTAFKRIPRWKVHLSTDRHRSFDEQIFSRLFLPVRGRNIWRRLVTPFLGGGYFQERHSTNIPPLRWVDGGPDFPRRWFWERGHLTTDTTGDREFLYLHFSPWQSNRWTTEAVAPWKNLPRLVNLPEGRPTGFTISRDGFTPLQRTEIG